ncbi:zf-RVT domain-containing protein, partial [Cephalotus follicularis]
GKGDKFSLWYDPWFYGSSVYADYGQRVIYDSGLPKSTLVEAVIENEHWNWPTTSPHLIEIQSRVQGIPISSSSDRIFWEVAGHQFSTKKAWALIRDSAPTVDWARLVWHPARIAKHAFCLWLAILNALNTLDKLFHRGILSSASCRFNCGQEESVSHLFFACPFTHHIWTEVLAKCNIFRPILPWPEEVRWMSDHTKGNKPPQMIRKLDMGATVYNIWMERNRRSFKNSFLPTASIIHKIQDDVATKLAGHERTFDHTNEHYHSLGINWSIVR